MTAVCQNVKQVNVNKHGNADTVSEQRDCLDLVSAYKNAPSLFTRSGNETRAFVSDPMLPAVLRTLGYSTSATKTARVCYRTTATNVAWAKKRTLVCFRVPDVKAAMWTFGWRHWRRS